MYDILITGGTGCIGAATIYQLLKLRGVRKIVIASRSKNAHLLKLWLNDEDIHKLEFSITNMADYNAVFETVKKINPTHIIHLAALQSPACSSDHVMGMKVNMGGTMALLDAATELPNLQRLVFASSAAVYGQRDSYTEDKIREDVSLAPPNHYGIWKLAGEHLARLFYQDTKIPTLCLRLNTTYGKGRDKGKTSAPTTALKVIAKGAVNGEIVPFEMPYKGRENYHFVEDVGAHFALSTLSHFDDYGNFNIKGTTIAVETFLDIAKAEAQVLGIGKYANLSISENAKPNLFISDLSHEKIDSQVKGLPLTSIREGIRRSLKDFIQIYEKQKDNL